MRVINFNLKDSIHLANFGKLASDLYKQEPGDYAAQANQINAALFVSGFLAMEHEQVLARCVLYNPAMIHQDKAILFFGNFEACDRISGLKILHSVIRFVREHYADYDLIGPVNGSTWGQYRIAENHRSLLFPGDICSGAFYAEIFSLAGLEVLYHYRTNLQTRFDMQKPFSSPNFTTTYFSKEVFEKRLAEIYYLTMEAFDKAPLFLKLSEKQFIDRHLQLLPGMDMGLIPFIMDEEQNIAGYAFCYSGFERDSIIVKTIARKKGRRYAGLGRMISDLINKMAQDRGAVKLFHAFMHEANSSNILSKHCSGERIKNYALYKYVGL